jgi:hypothetical protein
VSLSTFYTLCFFALLAGLVYGALLIRVPLTWIVVGGLIVNGIGIVTAASYAGAKPPSVAPDA